jgi:AcrR family transcriptional regulator
MSDRTPKPRPGAGRKRADDRRSTRLQLLEAAGNVFAEKGFDRATGKEIAARAGTNTAAVNYYFGGMDGLYAATLQEAHARLVNYDALAAAISDKPDARSKLEAVIRLFAGAVTGPLTSSWVLRVIGREIVAPSDALDVMREKEILPKARLLKRILGELMGLPDDHPAVARGCVSVVAPCLMLLIVDRQTLRRVVPKFAFGAGDAEVLVQYMVQYALAGLAAVAGEARRKT